MTLGGKDWLPMTESGSYFRKPLAWQPIVFLISLIASSRINATQAKSVDTLNHDDVLGRYHRGEISLGGHKSLSQ
jgi:hypothetical protein